MDVSDVLDPRWAAEYPFEHQWLDLGPFTMHYVDEGDQDASPILMVHGNPTWSFYYRHLIGAFSTTHRCVAVDHIGCGLSDKPRHGYSYRLEQRILDLERLVLELDLRDITLVVHDWGGAIGMGVAGRNPERFKRFVVFNTAAFRSERIPFSIDICRIPGLGPLMVQGFNAFARVAQVRAIADHSRLANGVGDAYLAPYDSWRHRIAIQKFVEDIPMTADHPSYSTLVGVEQGLEQFADHPMLLVWGDQDFCFDRSFRLQWQRRFPNAEVHPLGDASHFVLEDAYERIIPWMDEFMARSRD